MSVDVSFPSSARIQARCQDLVVEIGLPPHEGGDPNAWGPFDLLLCGLGTCTGYQVLSFLKERGIAIDKAGLSIEGHRDDATHLLDTIWIKIRVPAGFPEKYQDAIVRAAGMCPVKQQLGQQVDYRVSVEIGE